MMNLPFEIDLKDKVAVVTGAGGVLCSLFAKAIARCGAKVALLDLNLEAAAKFAAEIAAEGGEAKAYAVNVLKKDTLLEAREQIRRDFGACDILVNGAGGNNPRATTTNEYYFDGDIEKDITTFFNLDPAGVEFVFNLNFLGTLIPTQVFAEDMLGKEDACILNISSMNAFTPLTKIPAYSAPRPRFAILPSGWPSTSPRRISGSTPSPPAFSSPRRTRPCCLIRTEIRRPAPPKS